MPPVVGPCEGEIFCNVAAVMVRVAVPVLPLKAAVMVAVPAATPVARPLLLIVATSVFDELQITCVLISWLVPSEYMPEAANCLVFPTGTLGLLGVTEMFPSEAVDPLPPPPLSPPPPHVVKDIAKTPAKNIPKKNLIFFTAYLRPYSQPI